MNEIININHKMNKYEDREKKGELKEENEKIIQEIQIIQEKEERNKENCVLKKEIKINDKMIENIFENIININEKQNKDNNEKKIGKNENDDKKEKNEKEILKVKIQEENLVMKENKFNLWKKGDENKYEYSKVKKENNSKKERRY